MVGLIFASSCAAACTAPEGTTSASRGASLCVPTGYSGRRDGEVLYLGGEDDLMPSQIKINLQLVHRGQIDEDWIIVGNRKTNTVISTPTRSPWKHPDLPTLADRICGTLRSTVGDRLLLLSGGGLLDAIDLCRSNLAAFSAATGSPPNESNDARCSIR